MALFAALHYRLSSPALSASRRVLSSHAAPAVTLPLRKHRDELSVLRALAGTIQIERTEHLAGLSRDRWFATSQFVHTERNLLAKAAGRRAARWLVQHSPAQVLAFADEQPSVSALLPTWEPAALLAAAPTEAGLDALLQLRAAGQAFAYLQRLQAAEVPLSDDSWRALADCLAFHNGADHEPLLPEERFVAPFQSHEQHSAATGADWRGGGLTEQLWQLLPEHLHQDAFVLTAYCRGHAKFRSLTKAMALYEQLRRQGAQVGADTVRLLLDGTAAASSVPGGKLALVQRLLQELAAAEVAPDAQLFAAAVAAVRSATETPQAERLALALQLLHECHALRLAPPLALWTQLLLLAEEDPADGQWAPRGYLPAVLSAVEAQLAAEPQTEARCAADAELWLVAGRLAALPYRSLSLSRRVAALRASPAGRHYPLPDMGAVEAAARTHLRIVLERGTVGEAADLLQAMQAEGSFRRLAGGENLLQRLLAKALASGCPRELPRLFAISVHAGELPDRMLPAAQLYGADADAAKTLVFRGALLPQLVRSLLRSHELWRRDVAAQRQVRLALQMLLEQLDRLHYRKEAIAPALRRRGAGSGDVGLRLAMPLVDDLLLLACRVCPLTTTEQLLNQLFSHCGRLHVPLIGLLSVASAILDGHEPNRVEDYLARLWCRQPHEPLETPRQQELFLAKRGRELKEKLQGSAAMAKVLRQLQEQQFVHTHVQLTNFMHEAVRAYEHELLTVGSRHTAVDSGTQPRPESDTSSSGK